MISAGVAALLAAVLVAAPLDSLPDPQVKGKGGDGVVDLIGKREREGREGSGSGISGAKRQVLLVPACSGNEPAVGLADVLCQQAVALCASTSAPDDVMFWIFTGPDGVARPTLEQWVRAGQRCMAPSEASAVAGLPLFTAREFRRLPLPPGGVRVQPPNLRTLVNVPTNLFVEAQVTVLDTTLVGFPVRVRATPRQFRWRFGDGAGLVTDDPGAPYPDLRVTHTYTRAGAARLELVTGYSGEYSVAGGPWLPIDGVAQVSSPAVTLTVLDAHNQLVGGDG